MSNLSSSTTMHIGCLIGVSGTTGFLFQSAVPEHKAKEQEAYDANGNCTVIDFYDDELSVKIDAQIPNGNPLPQAGDKVMLTGIKAPTLGTAGGFEVTGTGSDTVWCYVRNPSAPSKNKDFQAISFEAFRKLQNGLPTSATTTST